MAQLPKDSGEQSGNISVQMFRAHMRDIPQHPLPEGYSVRPMGEHDVALWLDVQRDSEPLIQIDDGLFRREFGSDAQEITTRCFLVFDPQNQAVGTISAWYSHDFKGQDTGRIHWVSIRPSQRGKGLARAAMTFTMNKLAQWHERALLQTSTSRLTAIKIYLEFGFVPDGGDTVQAAAWRQVAGKLNHPTLDPWRK